ncbi:hypothetical protein DWW31_12160 [Clostridium sp. AF15-17LB]|nr:hypothetical protein DWW31_12160 [Clostridium sp. AF15-17LB]
MSLWKRAVLYIVRKRARNITLMVIMLTLTTISLLGMTIKQEVSASAEQLRKSLGGYFRLEKLTDADPNTQITDKMISDIMTDEAIIDHNEINTYYLYTKDLELEPGINRGTGNVQEHMPTLLGIYKSEKYESFLNGAFVLTKGRHIRPDDERKVVISDALAQYNHLAVGDQISGEIAQDLPGASDEPIGQSFTYEVVGIFHLNRSNPDTGGSNEADMQANYIFTDGASAKEVISIMRGRERDGYNGGAYFFVDDPKEMGQTIERLRGRDDLQLDEFKINSNSKTYQEAAAPLRNMNTICTTLLIIILVLSMLLLSLILILWMRERMHEIGILISIGISRLQIMLQFMTESLLIMILAFVLSFGVAKSAIPVIGENVKSSISQQQKAGSDESRQAASSNQELQIEIGMKECLYVFFMAVLITGGAVFISTLTVFRLRPKAILSSMS